MEPIKVETLNGNDLFEKSFKDQQPSKNKDKSKSHEFGFIFNTELEKLNKQK